MLIVNALIEKRHFAESAQSLIANVPGLFVCVFELVCARILEGLRKESEKEEGRKKDRESKAEE